MDENKNTKKKGFRKEKVDKYIVNTTKNVSTIPFFFPAAVAQNFPKTPAHKTKQDESKEKRKHKISHPDIASGGSKSAYLWYQMKDQNKTVANNLLEIKNINVKSTETVKRPTFKKSSLKKRNQIHGIEAEKNSILQILQALPQPSKQACINAKIRNTTTQKTIPSFQDHSKESDETKPCTKIVAYLPRVIEVLPCNDDLDNISVSSNDSNKIDDECLRRNDVLLNEIEKIDRPNFK